LTQQLAAHARAAHGDYADRLLLAVAELATQRSTVPQLRRVEARYVAGEVEVPLGPIADHRQIAAQRARHDVLRVAHEQGSVTDLRVGGDVLDHLRVVVAREQAFA